MVLKVRLFPYPRHYPDCDQTPAGAVVALLETQTSASLGSVWLQQSLNRGKPGIEFTCLTARPFGPPAQVAVFQQLCELPIRAGGLPRHTPQLHPVRIDSKSVARLLAMSSKFFGAFCIFLEASSNPPMGCVEGLTPWKLPDNSSDKRPLRQPILWLLQ